MFLPSGPPGAVGGNAATAAPHPLMEPETGGRALLDTRNRLTLYPAHIRQGDSGPFTARHHPCPPAAE